MIAHDLYQQAGKDTGEVLVLLIPVVKVDIYASYIPLERITHLNIVDNDRSMDLHISAGSHKKSVCMKIIREDSFASASYRTQLILGDKRRSSEYPYEFRNTIASLSYHISSP